MCVWLLLVQPVLPQLHACIIDTYIYIWEGRCSPNQRQNTGNITNPIPLVPPVMRAVIPLRDHLPSPELHPDVWAIPPSLIYHSFNWKLDTNNIANGITGTSYNLKTKDTELIKVPMASSNLSCPPTPFFFLRILEETTILFIPIAVCIYIYIYIKIWRNQCIEGGELWHEST